MATHQSGVILILCSGLALLWSTQSQLIRTANSCDDIICPGGDVQYDCSVPISGSVVVWRMMPECERNGEQPDIIFLFGDSQLSIVCNDRRKITVQGMTTSNGNRFVSTINVTNITSSQTVECLFDDGSQEEIVGKDTVYTTVPVPNVTNIDVTMDIVLITLDQLSLKENCTLIDYAVSSSTECGMCRSIVDNSISCTSAQVGAGCTVTIETTLCRMLEYVFPIDVTNMAPQLLITTGSNTPSNAQAGSLPSGVVAALSVFFTLLAVIVVIVVISIIIVAVFFAQGKKSKGTSYVSFSEKTGKDSTQGLYKEPKEMEEHQATSRSEEQNKNVSLKNSQSLQDQQRLLRKPLNAEGNNVELEDIKMDDTKARYDQPVDPPEILQDTSVQVDEVSTPVADSLIDTAVTESDNIVKDDSPECSQDRNDQSDEVITHVAKSDEVITHVAKSDEVITHVAESSKDTAAATDNNVKAHDPCGTKSDVPAVLSLENTRVDQAGGNDTIVASSAKNESTKCDSATKHTKEERSSDVFPNREVNTEGKSSTDENQTANSSEGAGSKVQDSSDLTDYVYTIPMVEKKEGRSDVFTNKEVSAEDKSNTDKNQTKAINSSEGAGSTAGDFGGQDEATNPVPNTGDDNPMMVTGGNKISTDSRYELPHTSNSRSIGDNFIEPFITPYGDSNNQSDMETVLPPKQDHFQMQMLTEMKEMRRTQQDTNLKIDNLEGLVREKNETIQHMQAQMNQLESEIDSLKDLLQEKDTKISELAECIQDLKAKMKEKSQVEEDKEKLLKKQVESVMQEKSQVEADKEKLKKQLETAMQEKDSLKALLQEKDTKISAQDECIQDLEAKMEEKSQVEEDKEKLLKKQVESVMQED